MLHLEERIHTDDEVDEFRAKLIDIEVAQMVANKRLINIYGKDTCTLSIPQIIKGIRDCRPFYKEKGFPVITLGYVLDDLHQALSNLDVHMVASRQADVEELLKVYRDKKKATPKRGGPTILENQSLAIIRH
jgi:hypothetical protein